MAKSNHASGKPGTHFEQVPIDVAKKVAEQDVVKTKTAGTRRVGVGPTSGKKS